MRPHVWENVPNPISDFQWLCPGCGSRVSSIGEPVAVGIWVKNRLERRGVQALFQSGILADCDAMAVHAVMES